MERRKLWIAGGVLLLVLVAAAVFALSSTMFPKRAAQEKAAAEARRETGASEDLCASSSTYDRLKTQLFAEAARVRKAPSRNLDLLAAQVAVRMEQPVLKSRDEALGVTVCAGRFVLDVPPGAERGFGGERRLTAEVEYAAQQAADGSGLVWRMQGAEPIVYKLATFDLQTASPQLPVAIEALEDAEGAPPVTSEPPAPVPAPPTLLPPPPPVVSRSPPPVSEAPARPAARPSFDCRRAGTRSELRVCDSPDLAALDRRMAGVFEGAMADADGGTRRQLLRSRDRFLAYRERCRSDACIAEAYQGRVQEIRDIADGR